MFVFMIVVKFIFYCFVFIIVICLDGVKGSISGSSGGVSDVRGDDRVGSYWVGSDRGFVIECIVSVVIGVVVGVIIGVVVDWMGFVFDFRCGGKVGVFGSVVNGEDGVFLFFIFVCKFVVFSSFGVDVVR